MDTLKTNIYSSYQKLPALMKKIMDKLFRSISWIEKTKKKDLYNYSILFFKKKNIILNNDKKNRLKTTIDYVIDYIVKNYWEEKLVDIDNNVLFDIINILHLQKHIQKVKNLSDYIELASNMGKHIILNIDLWNYCNHECSHCAISWIKETEKVDISKYLTNLDNIKDIDKLVSEVTFYNSWEIFDYEDLDKVFEYFLNKGIYKFWVITRWPYKESIDNITTKLKQLKQKYKEFNIQFILSFDNFSQISSEKRDEILWKLYYLNKYIFGNKKIKIKTTIPFETQVKNYNTFIKEILNFIEKYDNEAKNSSIDSKSKEDDMLDYIIIWDFKIEFDYNLLKPRWRWKNLTKIKTQKWTLLNCTPVFFPFIINLNEHWDIKTCRAKHYRSSIKYSYSNISDRDSLQIYLDKLVWFYSEITIDDLLWFSEKSWCMATNLIEQTKNKK